MFKRILKVSKVCEGWVLMVLKVFKVFVIWDYVFYLVEMMDVLSCWLVV